MKGYEGDDIVASATYQAMKNSDTTVLICSSDKDLTALVTDRVRVKSFTNGTVYDTDCVKAKFGVEPYQMVDFLALCGDSADNIVGAKGIGKVKAAELLTKYGNLEDLYTELRVHGTNFTPSLATALREFEPRMATVRELITLRTDVPLPFDEVFRERVPQDVAVFGDEEPIMEAIDVLHEAADGAETRPSAAVQSEPQRPEEPRPARAEQKAERLAVVEAQPLTSLMLAPRPYETQLEPQTYAEAKAMAADLFAARLFNGYGSAPAVLSTIIIGRELGLSAGASLRGFHIIDGKHAMNADLIRARVMASPVCEYFRCTERTAERASFVTKRKGDPPIPLTYTLDEGKIAFGRDESTPAAKLAAEKAWKASGWGKNSADMCVARCSSKLARLVYPDVVHGFYAPEELD